MAPTLTRHVSFVTRREEVHPYYRYDQPFVYGSGHIGPTRSVSSSAVLPHPAHQTLLPDTSFNHYSSCSSNSLPVSHSHFSESMDHLPPTTTYHQQQPLAVKQWNDTSFNDQSFATHHPVQSLGPSRAVCRPQLATQESEYLVSEQDYASFPWKGEPMAGKPDFAPPGSTSEQHQPATLAPHQLLQPSQAPLLQEHHHTQSEWPAILNTCAPQWILGNSQASTTASPNSISEAYPSPAETIEVVPSPVDVIPPRTLHVAAAVAPPPHSHTNTIIPRSSIDLFSGGAGGVFDTATSNATRNEILDELCERAGVDLPFPEGTLAVVWNGRTGRAVDFRDAKRLTPHSENDLLIFPPGTWKEVVDRHGELTRPWGSTKSANDWLRGQAEMCQCSRFKFTQGKKRERKHPSVLRDHLSQCPSRDPLDPLARLCRLERQTEMRAKEHRLAKQ
ncbi:hypothetical protein T439DRAFT_376077 [Meredithblackwellia eburnea MCA 4105]